MKYFKLIIRVSVLLLIILLAFTAIFPEWLDLKDMVIADYKPRIKQELNNELNSVGQGINKVIGLPGSILSYIHNTILKDILPKPSGGEMLGVICNIYSFKYPDLFLM